MTKSTGQGNRAVSRGIELAVEVLGWILLLLIAANILLALEPWLPEPVPGEGPPEFVEGVRSVMAPVNDPIASLLVAMGQPRTWNRIPLAPVATLILLLSLRAAIYYAVEVLERRAASRTHRRDDGELAEAERQAAARRVAVQAYADAKSVLEASRIELAFLSLDIVGSTKMKSGEDSVLVEQAFADYMKLVDGILKRNGAWKTTWTPDGQMAAFKDPASAVLAGQEILAALDRFNRETSRIKAPFRLRAGAHIGVVSTDERTPMEKISDFSIDVAGHMQKHSAVDALSISEKLFERLEQRNGFSETGEIVDGFRVYAWRPGAAA